MLSRLLTWLALWHFTLPVVSCWAVITELTEPVCKMCLSVVFLNIGCETRKLNSAVICHCQNSIKCKQLCMWKFDTDVTYGWSQNMFNWLGVCDEPVLCTGMYRMVQVFFVIAVEILDTVSGQNFCMVVCWIVTPCGVWGLRLWKLCHVVWWISTDVVFTVDVASCPKSL